MQLSRGWSKGNDFQQHIHFGLVVLYTSLQLSFIKILIYVRKYDCKCKKSKSNNIFLNKNNLINKFVNK